MLGLLFWPLVGALIGVSAAQRRGFGLAAGIISGLLLGPLAVFMFLTTGTRRRCPFCAEWAQKAASICPQCRKNIPVQPAKKSYVLHTIASLLFLGLVATFTVPQMLDKPKTPTSAKSATETTDVSEPEWYQGGTLQEASHREWKEAEYRDRLATAAGYVLAVKPRLGLQELRTRATDMESCMTQKIAELRGSAADIAVICLQQFYR